MISQFSTILQYAFPIYSAQSYLYSVSSIFLLNLRQLNTSISIPFQSPRVRENGHVARGSNLFSTKPRIFFASSSPLTINNFKMSMPIGVVKGGKETLKVSISDSSIAGNMKRSQWLKSEWLLWPRDLLSWTTNLYSNRKRSSTENGSMQSQNWSYMF